MKIKEVYSSLTKNISEKTVLAALVTFIAILIYYHLIYHLTVNVPQLDDFDAILGFANNYFSLDNALDRFLCLFSAHNEHRIAWCHLMTLLSYYAIGSINFRLLNLIGNLSLLGIIMIFFAAIKIPTNKSKILYLLPAIFFLFQPNYGISSLVAMASLSSLSVLFFSFLSLFLLTKRNKPYLFLALLSAVTATLTNGNGMLVFPIGFISLIYQKRYKESLLWFFYGGLTLLFYFTGDAKLSLNPNPLSALLKDPGLILRFFFSVLNPFNSVFLHKNIFFKFFIGLFFLLGFLGLFITGYFKKNITFASFLIFLFFSCLAIAIYRFGMGFQISFSRRYSILSILILILFYLILLENMPSKALRWFFPLFLTWSILFNLYSHQIGFTLITNNKAKLSIIAKSWNIRNGINSYVDFHDQKLGQSILRTAVQKELHKPSIE
jgi:hypothetical protein